MESIILNLLNLTGEERAAFAVLAPQRFHPDGDGLTVEDWQSAQVILGNPPPECLRGSTALRWLHTRSAGVDPYTAPGVLPSEAALTCSTGAYGHSVSEHLFALLLALMKRLPSYRDQQNRALWRDLGPVKTLLGAQVLVVGTGDLGSSFARLCQTLGASTSGVRRDPAKPAAGIELDPALSPAEKLKVVQGKMEQGDAGARAIYETIGVYLGYTLAFYAMFYEINHVLLMGRVTSGEGGDLVLAKAQEVLRTEYSQLKMQVNLPDEKSRRVGQSVAAASLPQIG